jgi:CHAT domain-containing protein/tetratricopeptide (TPR) repeat protein
VRRGVLGAAFLLACAANADEVSFEERIQSLRETGRYAEAAGAARERLDALKGGAAKKPWEVPDAERLARTLESIARLPAPARREMAEADRAGPSEREVETRSRILGAGHPEVATSLHAWAAVFAREDPRGAADLHARALAIRRKSLGNAHPAVIESLRRVANAYAAVSEWGLAERSLREAAELARHLWGDDPLLVAPVLSELADRLRWQNALAEAKEILQEAIALQRGLGAHPALGESLERLAMLHRFEREHEKAHALLVETVDIRRTTLGENFMSTQVARLNLALNHAYLGERETAAAMFTELRTAAATSGPDGPLRGLDALLDTYMASAAEQRGDWPEAETYLRATLRAMEAKGHTIEIAETLRKLGEARAARGDLEDAERFLARAAEAYEAARRKVAPGTSTATFKKTPYEQLALVRLERDRPGDAWPAIEAARARVLVDLLTEGAAPGSGPLAAAPFPLARIQAGLTPQDAIVGWVDFQIHKGAPRSWGYVVRNRGPVRWVKLGAEVDVETLAARLKSFRERLGAASASAFGGPEGGFQSEARNLWASRFAPLEPYLAGATDLVLVPSYATSGFPVDALIDADGRYVGERYSISYAPSATVGTWLAESSRGSAERPGSALLLGDPAFRAASRTGAGASSVRGALRGDSRSLGSLPRLEASRDEVERIAGWFPNRTVLLGRDASEPGLDGLVRSGGLARFGVLHLATHALVDDERPERSGLLLAEAGAADRPNLDGIVTGAEIGARWRLAADLVTLSACETAAGRNVFGEGVVGFSYPLFRAGARSVLVSLWKVDDRSTALLMEHFYRHWLGVGVPAIPKAGALREAKRRLREHRDRSGAYPYRHPYFWSAFVLVGDPG